MHQVSSQDLERKVNSNSSIRKLVKAIKSDKFEVVEELLSNCSITDSKIKYAFSNRIKELNKSDDPNAQEEAAKFIQLAFKYNLHTRNSKFKVGVETAIVSLMKTSASPINLELMAHLTEQAINKNLKLKSETIILVVRNIALNISKRSEFKAYCKLLKKIVFGKKLNLDDENTKKILDIALAGLSEPQLGRYNKNLNSRLKVDSNEIQVCRRLKFVAEISYELIKSKLKFDSERTQFRINMTIRGIFSGALGLLAQIEKKEVNNNPIIDDIKPKSIDKYLGLAFNYPNSFLTEEKIEQRKFLAEELTLSALILTNELLEQKENGRQNHINIINGSTINNLLLCFNYCCCIRPTNLKLATLVCNIIFKASNIPSISKKIHSKFLNLGLSRIYESASKSDKSLIAPLLLRTLSSLWKKGFRIDENLASSILSLYEKIDSDFAKNTDYSYLKNRMTKSKKKVEKSPVTINRRKLKGGLGDYDSNKTFKLIDLH